MSRAADFRRGARNSLSGYWGMPLLVCLLANIMGGGYTQQFGVNFTIGMNSNNFPSIDRTFHNNPFFQSQFIKLFLALMAGAFILLALVTIALTFVGGATRLGKCSYFCRLSLGERPPFETMFQGFRIFWKGAGLFWFTSLFVILWSFLFIIPGIIAQYRYALAPYIMAENPNMGIREAVDMSKRLMTGNKGRLFCLELSFIGWCLLSILTLGILMLWIFPYMETSRASFYLELTGRPYGISTYRREPQGTHAHPGPDPGQQSDREML